MTITLNGSGTISGLTTTGISAVQKLPAGTVLQVVNSITSTGVALTSTTFTDTTLTANITPSSSTSKILVILSQSVSKETGSADAGVSLKLLRNGSAIAATLIADYCAWTGVSGYNGRLSYSMSYFDSPATTSAITYKTQFAGTNTGQVRVQPDSGISSITLMEIAQ